jgi:Flp pilus assembly pilin Flp
MRLLKRLWRDKRGVIASTDLILLTTIVGIGLIAGIVVLRNQIVQEFGDIGTAVGELDQSYEVQGREETSSSGTHTITTVIGNNVLGHTYEDLPNQGSGQNGGGITVTGTLTNVEGED